MSWMQLLVDTYERCYRPDGKLVEGETPLLPIYHMTQQAHLEVRIDLTGAFRHGRGRVLEDRAERMTILPCTERSASRAGIHPVAHPLFDKLQYLAGDYDRYTQDKASSYAAYLEQLNAWCDSPYGHPKVRAVRDYLAKGCLMQDLISDRLLYQEDGALPDKWTGDRADMPPIFRAVPGSQLDALVRIRVIGGADSRPPWEDPSVWQSWIDYQNDQPVDRDYCYVQGRRMPVSDISPKGIRRPGDNAKLISSNDNQGFTYRGRFATAREALSLGRETTEKAHNALRWLIARQGVTQGDQTILAWGPMVELPAGLLDLPTSGLLAAFDPGRRAKAGQDEDPGAPQEDDTPESGDGLPANVTNAHFAGELRKALFGQQADLTGWGEVAVMGLDAATPGRLSMFYYREFRADDFFARLMEWHASCRWRMSYREQARPDGKCSAPSLMAIFYTAYGSKADDKDHKLTRSVVKRLLPCIAEGAPLPRDLMLRAAQRATHAVALDPKEAHRTLNVACALIRKYYNDQAQKEVWKMTLEEQLQGHGDDRSYLWGRALAFARKLEEMGQWVSGNDARQTNAERMQTAFAQHPAHIWRQLAHQLLPYLSRMRVRGPYQAVCHNYEEQMFQVLQQIDAVEGYNDDTLEPTYLLGYACQMAQFAQDAQAHKQAKADEQKEEQA